MKTPERPDPDIKIGIETAYSILFRELDQPHLELLKGMRDAFQELRNQKDEAMGNRITVKNKLEEVEGELDRWKKGREHIFQELGVTDIGIITSAFTNMVRERKLKKIDHVEKAEERLRDLPCHREVAVFMAGLMEDMLASLENKEGTSNPIEVGPEEADEGTYAENDHVGDSPDDDLPF